MIEQINNTILPQALMIGVEYNLFWTLNPKSLSPFIKAFELQQINEDRLCWQSGLYIRLAIASVMDSKVKYPSKPTIGIDNSDSIVDENKKMNHIKQSFMENMVIINSQFKKRGEILNE